MKKCILSFLLLGLSSFSFADLVSDFSVSNGNPNGVWSYGTMSSVGGTFNAFTVTEAGSVGTANFNGWYLGSGTLPGVYQLVSGTLNGVNGGVGGIAVGDVALHGASNGVLAVVRWTPTTGGIFNLSGFFGSGDSFGSQYGNIDAYVANGASILYSSLNTGSTQTFSLSNVSVTTGQSIDIIVGIGQDDYFYDSTPVNLQIQAVPEPATMAILGAGVLAVARRRKSA